MSRVQKYPRGSRGSPAKGVVLETAARVRISSSAPKKPRGYPSTFLVAEDEPLKIVNSQKFARGAYTENFYQKTEFVSDDAFEAQPKKISSSAPQYPEGFSFWDFIFHLTYCKCNDIIVASAREVYANGNLFEIILCNR